MIPSWVTRHIPDDFRERAADFCQTKFSCHIALVCKGRKVIAMATNKVGSRSCGCGYNKRSIHAEVNAIRTVGDITQLRGAVLFVIRLAPSGFVDSTPCHTCQTVIQKCVRVYGLRGCIHS